MKTQVKHYKINENLFLIYQTTEVEKVVHERKPVNHIWIYDRSGSMSQALPSLTNQLIDLSKKLPIGDTLSLGWFSGEGDYNFIVKGFKISSDSDYNILENIINQNKSSRGTTCFSEILDNTETVIKDLFVFSDVFSLHFFTDGYPVVRNYNSEINNIFSAINKIKGKINSAVLVGYGHYYNKELMSLMAEKLGAILIHNSLIPEYANSIARLVELSSSSEPKQKIASLDDTPEAVFTITDQGVVMLGVEDGSISVSVNNGKASVYYLTTKPYGRKAAKVKNLDEEVMKGLYAASLILTQKVKTDLAIEVMGAAGDKKIVDLLTNAYTLEEYGNVEILIDEAINYKGLRFKNGRDTNYLPPSNAFCFLDLINILLNDDKAYFYPYHEKFEYNKISSSSKVKDDYPKFIADTKSKCEFKSLVWHGSRLNLSVLTKINGYVNLKNVGNETPSTYGLGVTYPTFVWRNFSFVKDGFTNIKKFFVETSKETYDILKEKGIVFDEENGVYGVDISSIPVVNRDIVNKDNSAISLCREVMAEQKWKAVLKVIKYFKSEEFKRDEKEPETFSEKQKLFLEANGINVNKDSVYSPKKDAVPSTDKYMAKYFDIKIVGLSSLPAVKKVVDKIASGKALTPVEKLIEEGINEYDSCNGFEGEMKILCVNKLMSEVQKKMFSLRERIQKTKFSVILGKKWFSEFKTRSENEIEVDGVKFIFDLGEEVVEI